jgi:hypothetical protein
MGVSDLPSDVVSRKYLQRPKGTLSNIQAHLEKVLGNKQQSLLYEKVSIADWQIALGYFTVISVVQ